MACFKRKKKGMLHLLLASFRALPLDLMVPVSRRGFVWIFSSIFFSSFLFFLCPFSLGFSIQTRYLSSIVSLDTFAHAHSQKSAGSKCQKKFGTIYHFDINLIWSRWVNRGHLISCQFFKRPQSEKAGHTAKNVKSWCFTFSRVLFLSSFFKTPKLYKTFKLKSIH